MSESLGIAQHYDAHLAEHYSWLFGGLPERTKENRAFFEKISLSGKAALDIGAGSGFQSIPLAQIGFRVTAVDLSAKLLEELERNRGDLQIQTVRADILQCIVEMKSQSFDACVCMGDTVTHLQSFGDVQRLLRDTHRVLATGGRFVIALRDFTKELRGDDRFIPVRADEQTIFSCFLEYEGDHVRVYDVVHQLRETNWEMRVSSYKKLRIAPDWLEKRAREVGFDVVSNGSVHGMITIDLRKR
jgi:ubiquinone/menaquinone biosynthesis C-methylase UbiE